MFKHTEPPQAPCTTVVPPIMVMLSKLDIVPNYDLSHLRLLVVGAAPLAPETEQAVLDRLQECNPGINLEITQGNVSSDINVFTISLPLTML